MEKLLILQNTLKQDPPGLTARQSRSLPMYRNVEEGKKTKQKTLPYAEKLSNSKAETETFTFRDVGRISSVPPMR